MRKPRNTDSSTTSLYHLRFLLGDWVADFSDEEKTCLRHLLFVATRALIIEIIDYAITPRGLEVLVKVPPRATTEKLRPRQLLHLMSLLRGDSKALLLAHGLEHPVPRLRASYTAQIERQRAICCDLSVFGKLFAQSYARWWKTRHPGKLLVWRGRFWSQLLPNTRAATIATSAVILETLRSHGISPAAYPWRAVACPPPAPPKSIRAIPEFQPAPGGPHFKSSTRQPAKRKGSPSPATIPSLKEQILALLPQGHTQAAIAAMLGCTRAYVCLVKIKSTNGKVPAIRGRKRLPPAVALNRQQAATLREALTTKSPGDFDLPTGGYSQPWNRLNVARLCRVLFGHRSRSSNLDALLVSWKVIRPPRTHRG